MVTDFWFFDFEPFFGHFETLFGQIIQKLSQGRSWSVLESGNRESDAADRGFWV